MEFDWGAFYAGFLLSIGLIVAIGPQNAYVLRKGLKKRHVLLSSTICFLSDAFLISLGAAGVGALIRQGGTLSLIITVIGVLFLIWYGAKSFKDAIHPKTMTEAEIEKAGEKTKGQDWPLVVLSLLAFTFLNPHVYVDTLLIIGGISAQYDLPARYYFTGGAILASAVWFYGLGFGAGFFSKAFQNPKAWRVLDIIIGIIMWAAAAYLAYDEYLHLVEA